MKKCRPIGFEPEVPYGVEGYGALNRAGGEVLFCSLDPSIVPTLRWEGDRQLPERANIRVRKRRATFLSASRTPARMCWRVR